MAVPGLSKRTNQLKKHWTVLSFDWNERVLLKMRREIGTARTEKFKKEYFNSKMDYTPGCFAQIGLWIEWTSGKNNR